MEYQFVAYNKNLRITKGRISAADEKAANLALDDKGYKALSLKRAIPFVPNLTRWLPSLSKAKTTDVVMFSRQLAMLIQSGSNFGEALELLASQTASRALREALEQISTDIRHGSSISAAFARQQNVFPEIYSRLLSVGECTGSVEGILKQLADYLERRQIAASKIKTAMAYPMLIMGVAVVSVSV
ncbi:MAG TPA: type II secretion system F family protein, partial [Dehalococcoidia bacterium]|nr:type II secretion system F family protein [Dehalococcoidia bacterium]